MSLDSIRREFRAIQELRNVNSVLRLVLVVNLAVLFVLGVVCFSAGFLVPAYCAVAVALVNGYLVVVS